MWPFLSDSRGNCRASHRQTVAEVALHILTIPLMFSTPPPAPSSRNIAANALRGAGLIDHDQKMRDSADKPGGRKGSSKIRSHRQRPIDDYKDHAAGPSRTSMVNTRLIQFLGTLREYGVGFSLLLLSKPRLTFSFIALPPSSASKALIPCRSFRRSFHSRCSTADGSWSYPPECNFSQLA